MLKVLIAYAVNGERISVDVPGWEVRYVRTGIGKAKAAMRLTDAIHEQRPDVVINEGTAATANHGVGEVFICRHFIDRDFEKIQIAGLDYEQDSCDLLTESHLFEDWTPEGVCNTGDSFLTEEVDSEGDVYDMEAYAEALVCNEKKIPFISVKCVTDVIGQNSVDDWNAKITEANIILSNFFQSIDANNNLMP